MAWIEAHQSLAESPKLMKLCKRLKIPHSQGIGHLFFLWWWALDHAPDGDLSALGATGVARVVRWEGEHLRSVLPALKKAGFVDEDNRIHDWQDYAGRLISKREEKREQDRERRRKQRRLNSDKAADPVAGDAHATRALQNRTQPNTTEPLSPDAPQGAVPEGNAYPDAGDDIPAVIPEEASLLDVLPPYIEC